MMSHRKQPERRTFLQDRFEILIKRQKSGEATFTELTELDEIVNSDPEIRDRIIRESMLMERIHEFKGPSNGPAAGDQPYPQQKPRRGLLNRIKSLIKRIFTSQVSCLKTGNLIIGTELSILL
jgi:hypothetical protein